MKLRELTMLGAKMNDELDCDQFGLTPNTSTEPNNNAIHEAVEFYWGERCPVHEDGCPTCTAWRMYDKLIGETE